METQTKVMIGGAVVIALFGYYWYEKKKSSGGGLDTGAAPAGEPAGSLPAAPPYMGTGPSGPMQPTSAPTGSGPIGVPVPPPAGYGGPQPPLTPVARAQPAFNPALASSARFSPAASPASMSPVAGSRDTVDAYTAQALLNNAGANPLVPNTGTFDATTRSALASFQARVGVPATGYADAKTVADLRTMGNALLTP